MNLKKWIFFLSIFAAATLQILAQNRLSEPLSITTQDWRPYNYSLVDGSIEGMATD